MIRQIRIRLAHWLLPKDLTTTGVGEQTKLVDALRDALKEVSRLADYAAQLEGMLAQQAARIVYLEKRRS